MEMKTAGILLISDNLLLDLDAPNNVQCLVRELIKIGYEVPKVVVLVENENSVLYELEFLIKHYDLVFTIGGTINGFIYRIIAKHFCVDLHENAALSGILKRYNKEEILVPLSAKFLLNDTYPIVYLQRIFVLNQWHFRETLHKSLRNHLLHYKEEVVYLKKVVVSLNGKSHRSLNSFKDELEDLGNCYGKLECTERSNECGSYVINISALTIQQLLAIETRLISKLDMEQISYRSRWGEAPSWNGISLKEGQHIQKTVQAIENCLLEYGPENVFLSFNGGKDCTVLLHLIILVLKRQFPEYEGKVFCLYVKSESPFSEQDDFIEECRQFYDLDIITIQSGIKAALNQILNEFPNYKACFMGTRRTDPFSGDLKTFQMTDAGWPQIMRVNPLLDWRYSDIWDYLLYNKVPYCSLYDMGYTSLGNTVNTIRNPSLLYYNVLEQSEMYLPAYKLTEEAKERNGRNAS